jgi:hypothetical protein
LKIFTGGMVLLVTGNKNGRAKKGRQGMVQGMKKS